MDMSVQIKGYICTTREQSALHCYIRVEGRVRGKIKRVVDKDRTDITKVKRKSNSRRDEWETVRQLLH